MAQDLQKRLERARKSLEKNKLRDAISDYQAVLEIAPENLEALQSLGNVYIRQNDPEPAAHYFGLQFEALLQAGDVVKAKKPAPDIYLLAAERLGVRPAECVVVEDSNNGVESAAAAAMKCVVTVSGYTREEDFSKAAIVLTCLGDPGAERCEVLANRSAARPGAYFTAADLEGVLA